MSKKMISLFTLVFFTLFVYSCTTKKWRTIETMNTLKKRYKVVKVVNNSEEVIKFTNKGGGEIYTDFIKGVAFDSTTGKEQVVTIPVSEVKRILLKRFSFSKTLGLIAISIVGFQAFMIISFVKGT